MEGDEDVGAKSRSKRVRKVPAKLDDSPAGAPVRASEDQRNAGEEPNAADGKERNCAEGATGEAGAKKSKKNASAASAPLANGGASGTPSTPEARVAPRSALGTARGRGGAVYDKVRGARGGRGGAAASSVEPHPKEMAPQAVALAKAKPKSTQSRVAVGPVGSAGRASSQSTAAIAAATATPAIGSGREAEAAAVVSPDPATMAQAGATASRFHPASSQADDAAAAAAVARLSPVSTQDDAAADHEQADVTAADDDNDIGDEGDGETTPTGRDSGADTQYRGMCFAVGLFGCLP